MAEENSFLASISHSQQQDASSNNIKELFGSSSSNVWQSQIDMNQDKEERSKYLLTGDMMSTRIQQSQGLQCSGYNLSATQGGDGGFDYQKEMQNLEKMSAELDAVKQQLMTDILRCQLLQVDLATQFDPKLVQKLRSTKLSCEKCDATFDENDI